jgi:hypothetical protein
MDLTQGLASCIQDDDWMQSHGRGASFFDAQRPICACRYALDNQAEQLRACCKTHESYLPRTGFKYSAWLQRERKGTTCSSR